ncbi:MAG: phosphoribosylformylglycinamidine cyclo-ligase [Nanoarchaeota archaeon]|nr:phosphoribosylformylglycinamidine cyclo-ligase [Nanoarchaeota archaeon]
MGLLSSEKRANALYYTLIQNHPLVPALKKLVVPLSYKAAGVDIDAANLAVQKMKKYVQETFNNNVLSNVGSFGGLYSIDRDNALVASTDGVGTKLKVAFATKKHDTIGQDLVNHCVNDILVMGAKPLFFLDYIGTGKLEPNTIVEIVKGIAKACKENGAALIGGETAEMPGVYKEGEYDLASCIVGKVKKANIITGESIKPGDIVLGLPSNGLHTNGYSLALKVLLDHAGLKLSSKPSQLNCTLGEELLKVHRSYLKSITQLQKAITVKGMAHITGGGVIENIPRILPNNASVEINKNSWKTPGIFQLIQEQGKIEEQEMFRVFNMGIGFVVIIEKKDVNKAKSLLKNSIEIGKVVEGNKKVNLI